MLVLPHHPATGLARVCVLLCVPCNQKRVSLELVSLRRRGTTSDWGDIYKIIGFRVCDVSIIIRDPPSKLPSERKDLLGKTWGGGMWLTGAVALGICIVGNGSVRMGDV